VAEEPPASAPDADEAYQSLYRRYRPQRFEEVRGQEHVTRALRNAVRDDHVAHAYLFSGPRGTGKTSTARILAMALNCEHPADGEPDGTCPSCVDIRRGASLDVQELDAASNRKLDEMRDLLSRVALGTRGRWKVYIVDEVHQLTADAASALLKTLEEPPAHVVFVLATTDPQKVLPTIRSRTQHFEFRLLGADVLSGLLRDVNDRAALGLAPEAIDLVVRRGHGSARDALSVLDQVVAAGEVEDESDVTSSLTDAIADQDPGRVLTAVAEAMSAGRDPRRLATDLLDHLRNGFLATQARSLVHLSDDAVAEVEGQARRLGLAGVVKAMEVVGQAAVDMRESVDPRVTLEVALVRVASPRADTDSGALLRRLEHLEAQVAALTGGAPPAATAPVPAPGGPVTGPRTPPVTGSTAPAAAVDASRAAAPSPAPPTRPPATAAPSPAPATPPAPAVAGAPPARPAATGAERRPSVGAPPPQPGRARASAPPSGPTVERGRPVETRAALGAHRRGGGAIAPGVGPPGGTAAGAGSSAVAPVSSPPGPAPQDPGADRAGATGDGSLPPRGAGTPTGPGGEIPSRDELTKAWGDDVLPALRPAVKAYVSSGRFVDVDAGSAVYALPDQGLLGRAQALKAEVEAALGTHFGRPVPLRLVLDGDSVSVTGAEPAEASAEEDPSSYDLDQLADAGPAVVSPEQRLLEAFPGAEEVTP
jgi:DNA polymerase-3 subunit gamma/tau